MAWKASIPVVLMVVSEVGTWPHNVEAAPQGQSDREEGAEVSRLIKVAAWKGKPHTNVIFVHGLGGHVYGTWRRGVDDGTFWPLWLAQDLEGIAVYSLAYDAPASNWLGT